MLFPEEKIREDNLTWAAVDYALSQDSTLSHEKQAAGWGNIWFKHHLYKGIIMFEPISGPPQAITFHRMRWIATKVLTKKVAKHKDKVATHPPKARISWSEFPGSSPGRNQMDRTGPKGRRGQACSHLSFFSWTRYMEDPKLRFCLVSLTRVQRAAVEKHTPTWSIHDPFKIGP